MREYTQEFLNEKVDNMFSYLQKPVLTMDSENEVVERLMMLGKMLAESGEYKSVASYKVDEILHGEIGAKIGELMSEKITASTLNMYVKSACKDWNFLVNAFDRINSAATKQMMALQVLISLEKEKMKML